jgi:hypothetical protein
MDLKFVHSVLIFSYFTPSLHHEGPNLTQYLDLVISNVVMVPSLEYSLQGQACSLLIAANFDFATYLSVTLRDSTVDLRSLPDHLANCTAIYNPNSRWNVTTAMEYAC